MEGAYMLKSYSLDDLQEQYINSSSHVTKERILGEVTRRYLPLIRKRANVLAASFPHTPHEDFCQIIKIGIWQGLNRRKQGEPTTKAIFRRVRFEISKELQKYFTKKNPILHESGIDISDYILSGATNFCDTTFLVIARVDIESAISRLPILEQQVVSLWYQGYDMKTIVQNNKYSRSHVYEILDSAKKYLSQSLQTYEMCAYA